MNIYDVFISYRHKDAEVVSNFADALRSEGLVVWIDEHRIDDLTSIQAGIEDGLTNSKSFVAWYSNSYTESRPCQWEFTAAFTTALAADQAMERILVINPEGNPDHIEPEFYQDQKYVIPSGENHVGLAKTIKRRLEAITGTFGDFVQDRKLMAKPPWYGRYATSADYFTGRLGELWRIHSALHADQYPVIHARTTVPLAQVIGLGGMGKSLLAEEYGLRFGSQYPGGIFWLNARGDVDDQLETFAINLGLPKENLKPAEVRTVFLGKLRKSKLPFLWIVDDIEESIDEDTFQRWLLPDMTLARMLITTRALEFEGRGSQLVLDELSSDEAFDLLTRKVQPESSQEIAAAESICLDLGNHPLALDVASRAIAGDITRPHFAKYRERLNNPSGDELEFAASLKGRLPNGHEKSIAATLGESFKSLSEKGKNLLRLSAVLASAPIPTKLALGSLANYHKIHADEAERLLRLGVDELENSAFSRLEPVGNTFQVHALVARTVRYHGVLPNFEQPLRETAVATLIPILSGSGDIRKHASLVLYVIHAKHLAELPSNKQEAILGGWLAYYEYTRGAYSQARQLHERVLVIFRRILGDEHPDTLRTMSSLATTLRAEGDLAGARQLQERVIEMSRRILGDEHTDTLTFMNNLAETLDAQGDLAGSRQLHERVLEISRRTLGEDHTDTLGSMNNLALTLWNQGNFAGARQLQERVLEVCHRTLGEEHTDTLNARNNLATTLQKQGDLAGARQLHEQVLEVRRRILGEENPETLITMNNLAATLDAQGDHAGARQLHEQVLEVSCRALGEEHPNTLSSMNNLAATLRAEGDLAGARQLLERVLKISRRTLGEEHPHTSISAWNLLTTLADYDETAADVFQRSLAWLLQAKPESLSDEQAQMRKLLISMMKKLVS